MSDTPDPAQAGRTHAKDAIRTAILPVTLSIAAGFVTALLEVSIGLGIIAALLVGVIVLQIQLLITIGRADVEAQVTLRGLAPVTTAQTLDRSTGEFLLSLATAQVEFLTSARSLPPVFDLELEHQRDVLLAHYKESAQGRIRVNLRAEPVLRETEGVSAVRKTLDATSVVPAMTYWGASSGQDYLKQQEGMLEDGVRIRRVFIQSETSLGELADVMAAHLAWRGHFGDTALDVRVTLIDETLESDLVKDFAVVDGDTVIGLEIQPGIPQPVAVVWEAGPGPLVQATRRFERLWKRGHDPTDFPAFR